MYLPLPCLYHLHTIYVPHFSPSPLNNTISKVVVSSHFPFFFIIFFYVKEIRNKVQEQCYIGKKALDFRETRMPFLLPEADMSKAGVIVATYDSAYVGDVEIIFLNHCYFSYRQSRISSKAS